MSELLIGCGNDLRKKMSFEGIPSDWTDLTTLDVDPDVKPNVVHDLNVLPYPFKDNQFTEIHAYEVLEHCGKQGDWKFYFDQFAEFWRILQPNGFLVASTPMWDNPWAWGDPGHTRLICKESLIFLNQDEYKQIGRTAMTDYRPYWKGNFVVIGLNENNEAGMFGFVLKAVK